MLKEMGAASRSIAILIPHSPGNRTSLTEQMRNAMLEANQTGHTSRTPTEQQLEFVTPEGVDSNQGPLRSFAPGDGHARERRTHSLEGKEERRS